MTQMVGPRSISSRRQPRLAEVYRPFQARGAALALWKCRDEEILIEGPAGTGKTRAILEKVYYCSMKYPNSRYLLVRKTRESMTQSVLTTFEEKVLPADSPLIDGPRRNLRQVYYCPNGSMIVVGGMDKPTKIMSTEYDMVCCFEATELTEEDIENLTTRLRNYVMPYQQLICDCNPGVPSHWLNKRAARPERMTRLLSRHEDNPTLFSYQPEMKGLCPTDAGEKYLAKLDRLSGARRLRLRGGIWAAQEGMVYENWDENLHVIHKFRVPGDWQKIRSIDFGFTNPFVCQWWAMDEDRRMYLYREIYFSHRLIAVHAETILKYSEGETYAATIADWDSGDRATLGAAGIETIPAFKQIQPGIEAVNLRLNKAGDDRPRLFIMEGCSVETDHELVDESLPVSTQEEMPGYHYPKPSERGKPRSKEEEPVDKDNHGMDAMRYAVAYVDEITGLTFKVDAEKGMIVNRV